MEDARSRKPKYTQLVRQLERLIGEIAGKEDTCLPSERELCEKYAVSRITVRRALSELEEAGQIYRVQGKGALRQKPEALYEALSADKLDRRYAGTQCALRL